MPLDKRELKTAALAGLRHERQRLDELISGLERELGIRSGGTSGEATPRKRRLSAAGREKIVAGLHKRWAAQRKASVAKPALTGGAGEDPDAAAQSAGGDTDTGVTPIPLPTPEVPAS